MSCTVTLPPTQKLVTPAKMKDGEIGRIVKWGQEPSPYYGTVVKKCGQCLFSLNKDTYWNAAGKIDDQDYLIEIFPQGTVITITID